MPKNEEVHISANKNGINFPDCIHRTQHVYAATHRFFQRGILQEHVLPVPEFHKDEPGSVLPLLRLYLPECILMDALMESLQEILRLSDEQLTSFTAELESRLPKYLREALRPMAIAA